MTYDPSAKRHLYDQDWRDNIGGYSPVQAYGRVDGLPFYFGARGDRWQFAVAGQPDGDPLEVWFARQGVDGGFFLEEPCDGAGMMERSEAIRVVETCLARFATRSDHADIETVRAVAIRDLRDMADRIEAGEGDELGLDMRVERHPRTKAVLSRRLTVVMCWPEGRKDGGA